MSFDLAVWVQPVPRNAEEAQELYELLSGDEPPGTVQGPLATFLEEVLTTYPALEALDERELDDPERDVWSVTPVATASAIFFCIRWSVAGPVHEFIVERARRRGLVVYDPQNEEVWLPGVTGSG